MEYEKWDEVLAPYNNAVEELKVKFKNIRKEFLTKGEYSPIEFVTGRTKKIASIVSKAKRLNIQDIDTISDEDKAALGLTADPEIRYGKLFLHCTKYGSGKLTISAIAGGNAESDASSMGGTVIEKTVSVMSRGVASDNGGWL